MNFEPHSSLRRDARFLLVAKLILDIDRLRILMPSFTERSRQLHMTYLHPCDVAVQFRLLDISLDLFPCDLAVYLDLIMFVYSSLRHLDDPSRMRHDASVRPF